MVLELFKWRVYEAKVPMPVNTQRTHLNSTLVYDDREIQRISDGIVYYDSPLVSPKTDGQKRNLPSVTIEDFLKWAGRDVTDEMPKGEWREVDRP